MSKRNSEPVVEEFVAKWPKPSGLNFLASVANKKEKYLTLSSLKSH